jgi:hypothetical protein
MLYGPGGPRSLPKEHALYRRLVIEPVQSMPERVGSFLVPIVKPAQLDQALLATFTDANMIAVEKPSARLTVTWRSIDAPARISNSSHATVVIGYELRRIDNGATIFRRDITTRSSASGGDGAERLKANARMAIQRNIASIVACLDKAAYGTAPPDCAI